MKRGTRGEYRGVEDDKERGQRGRQWGQEDKGGDWRRRKMWGWKRINMGQMKRVAD